MSTNKTRKLNHIALAVNSLHQGEKLYEKILGLEVKHREIIENQGVSTSMLVSKEGDTSIELLEPLDESSPIFKFLQKHGEGIHHICFEVENIENSLEHLKKLDIELIDERPRIGACGAKVAFVHPKSINGVLIELAEFPREET